MSKFGSMVTDVIADFSDKIETLVAKNFGILYDLVYPVWVAGVSLYFMFIIYSMIHQGRDIDIQEFTKHMTVLALITAFLGVSGNDGYFITNIVPFVMNSGDEISAKIMGGESASSLVETLFQSTNTMIDKLWSEAGEKGWFDDKIGAVVMASIQSVLLFIGGIILALFAFVYIVITKLMIGVLLSLGGVFIMFSAFPATRQMFSAWVGSCFNYVFLNISFSISFTIILAVIDSYTKVEGAGLNLMTTIAICFLYLSGILLLQQLTVMTSTLTGGVGINGLTSAVNSVGGFGKGMGRAVFSKRKDTSDMKDSRAMVGAKAVGKAYNYLRGKNGVKG